MMTDDKSVRSSQPLVWGILFYLTFCMAVVVAGFVLAEQVLSMLSNFGLSNSDVWQMGLWGGVGAITSAIHTLWVHATVKKDHQPSHTVWYFTAPPLGFISGVIVGLIIEAALPLIFARDVPALSDLSPALLYLLAYIVGFQRDAIVRWFKQALHRTIALRSK